MLYSLCRSRRVPVILIFALSFGSLTACNHITPRKKINPNVENRIQKLGESIQNKDKKINRLREENLVLRQLVGIKTQSKRRGFVRDSQIYSEVVKAYRSGELAKLTQLRDMLQQKFPQSHYLDNAVFLVGHLNMKKKHYGKALKIFDQVIENFPKGNKRAAAMLSKGVAYKKLSLKDRAKIYFDEVMVNYPGSPESLTAKNELKKLIR